MATRQYENPWASGIKSLTGAYVAKQQGLAEQAAAQQAAQLEAEQWAREFDLQQQRTLSQLARDRAGIRLDKQEYGFNERHNPLLLDQTQAQTFSANASGQSALASAENARLRSEQQRLLNLAAQNNMGVTGGRSTDVFSPGQSEVYRAETLTRLAGLAKNIEAERAQLPEGSPQAAELDQTLNVLRSQIGQNQRVYDMTTSTSASELAAQRAQVALRKLDAGEPLTEREQRDIQLYETGQAQTDAAVGALTDSQSGAVLKNLMSMRTGISNVRTFNQQALEQLETNGNTITGIPGAMVGMADTLRATVDGFGDMVPIDEESFAWLDSVTAPVAARAGDRKILNSVLTDLAIMNYRLKYPEDPRMSNFDLEVALKPVAGGSAEAIKAYLQSAVGNLPKLYTNYVDTLQAFGVEVPEGARSMSGPAQPTPPEAAPQGQGGFQLAPEDAALLNKYLN